MAGDYLGDYVEDETLYFLWSTNDGNGGSITRATDGTVSVYKDNGTTQSVAGITDTEDFDSLTGIHACTIDLSADAFYATGADYAVVLSAATIDGQTVNAVLKHFSIQNRYTRGTDSAAPAAALATAQADLDIITGADGANLLSGTQTSIDAIETDTGTTIPALLPAALVGGRMDADVGAISTSTAAADNLEASAEVLITGAAEAGTLSTTQMTTDLTEATDDHYIGRTVIWTSGVLLGQASDITDYAGATGLLTYSLITDAPSAADTFVIV